MTAALRHHSNSRATSAHPPLHGVPSMAEWTARHQAPRLGVWRRFTQRFTPFRAIRPSPEAGGSIPTLGAAGTLSDGDKA